MVLESNKCIPKREKGKERVGEEGVKGGLKLKGLFYFSCLLWNFFLQNLHLQNAACVLVPGGFGDRGVRGMILAAKYARENNIPYLGICLGMQISVIEFARSVSDLLLKILFNLPQYNPSLFNCLGFRFGKGK